MATFVRIDPIESSSGGRDRGSQTRAGSAKNLEISLDVGRTLGLLLIGVLVLGGALTLYLENKGTPAAAFFSLGEAIVVSGFGVVIGERSGASEALQKLG